jgi:hypothetical protein
MNIMNTSDITEVIHNKKDLDLKIRNNPKKIYIVDSAGFKPNTFKHYQLPDGMLIDGKIYLNSLECKIFTEYFKNLGIKSEFSSVNHVSDFSNIDEIGCKGKVVALGRYFKSGTSEVPWGSEPRGVISKSIYDNKESTRSSNILEWDANFKDVLEHTLVNYIDEGLLDPYEISSEILKEYIPKVIVTALPNRDLKNRFSSFLASLDFQYENRNLLITDNFFVQTREVEESTRGTGYQDKRRILEGLYEVNKEYIDFYSKRTQIIIVDDVLTTGCHFEIALETLKNTFEKGSYEVLGVFLSATQSNFDFNDDAKLLKFKKQRYEILS